MVGPPDAVSRVKLVVTLDDLFFYYPDSYKETEEQIMQAKVTDESVGEGSPTTGNS